MRPKIDPKKKSFKNFEAQKKFVPGRGLTNFVFPFPAADFFTYPMQRCMTKNARSDDPCVKKCPSKCLESTEMTLEAFDLLRIRSQPGFRLCRRTPA